MANSKATTNLEGIFLPTQVMTSNPAKAGRRVEASQMRKLVANPIMAIRHETERFEAYGSTHQQRNGVWEQSLRPLHKPALPPPSHPSSLSYSHAPTHPSSFPNPHP